MSPGRENVAETTCLLHQSIFPELTTWKLTVTLRGSYPKSKATPARTGPMSRAQPSGPARAAVLKGGPGGSGCT